ncbi:hypothetical protein M422DRAFT_264839 [Sphaerobolus stellatus SS14]|uniref:Uncharacterized protein n=1 Tax=Sphaerobolus stellatus (strain SS14) TaxID=990650 RepID=A0A0C9TSL9_SPHS4|nr:hypothetical protein M422DRAFT_264839 [Sphaerobolus stellatus SS14]
MTTEAERLSTLELTLAEERLKTKQIENQLQQLIELLNPTRAAIELAPPGNAPSVQVMDEDTPGNPFSTPAVFTFRLLDAPFKTSRLILVFRLEAQDMGLQFLDDLFEIIYFATKLTVVGFLNV